MSNWGDQYIEDTAVFASLLMIGARRLPEVIGQLNIENARIVLQSIRSACDEFEKALDAVPPRVLSPEEYEAKVEAGKKIKLDPGGKY